MPLPTIDIRIAIVAHTSRLDNAARLAKHVDANYLTVDDGTLGCTNNHKHAWNWQRNQTSQWALVMEDDAQPIDNFRQELEKALLAAPTPLVSLYLGRGKPEIFQQHIEKALHRADTEDAHWLQAPDCTHAVAIALQTIHIPEMLNTLFTPYWMTQPIDNAISMWARQQNITTSYTLPSLVDHDDTLPTLATKDGRPKGRTAWRVGTHKTWNSDCVQL